MKKLLVVDDSNITRLLIKAIVENHFTDWQVDLANDANQAQEMCSGTSYDFITLDMNMPGRDGLTVAPELMSSCPNAKIALLTGNSQERVRELAKKQGLVFVNKPVTEKNVLAFLRAST